VYNLVIDLLKIKPPSKITWGCNLTGFRKFKGRIGGFTAEGEVDFFG
jgi:hypothetical protein